MSELSAQCDELRAMAESVGLEVPQAATLMMDAADTILSLRDRAQALQADNAKLRELCTALYRCRDKVSECGTCEDVACPLMHDCRLHDRMRELGIEVDE